MKVCVARKEKKLHSVLWVMSKAEYERGLLSGGFNLSGGDDIKILNDFLSAKDPYSLISVIERFGFPLMHKEMMLDSSFKRDGFGFKRVYRGIDFLTNSVLNRYSDSSRRALANECWFLLPGCGCSEGKESSAKRVTQEYSIKGGAAIREAINQTDSDCFVIEEPLLDWLWMKNMLALMLSIKHSLMSDVAEISCKPLESCGFSLNRRIKNHGLAEGHHSAFVLPLMRSDYARFTGIGSVFRETILDYFLPGGNGGTCRWAPYSYYGFQRETANDGTLVTLKTSNADKGYSCMSYLPECFVLGRGGTIADYSNSKQKIFIEIQGDTERQNRLARQLFNEFLRNRLCFGDYGCDFDSEGKLVPNTLESCLWLSLIEIPGLKLGRCENCGLPFFATENSLKRFCSSACQQSAYRETHAD